MTAHLEVSQRTSADWEYAILAGYSMFRALRQHRGGTVHADLEARTLTFTPPTASVVAKQQPVALRTGTVVVFEGLDKAGKSTQLDLLREAIDPVTTTFAHMPSGFGEFTRRLYRLLETTAPTSVLARQLAHLACHADSIDDIVAAEERGAVVLDRWWWSALAYGLYANPDTLGISKATFRELVEQVWKRVEAHVVFLFLTAHSADENNAPGVKEGYEAIVAESDPDRVVLVPVMSEKDTHVFVIAELVRRGLVVSAER
jgi:thymidylate kinase